MRAGEVPTLADALVAVTSNPLTSTPPPTVLAPQVRHHGDQGATMANRGSIGSSTGRSRVGTPPEKVEPLRDPRHLPAPSSMCAAGKEATRRRRTVTVLQHLAAGRSSPSRMSRCSATPSASAGPDHASAVRCRRREVVLHVQRGDPRFFSTRMGWSCARPHTSRARPQPEPGCSMKAPADVGRVDRYTRLQENRASRAHSSHARRRRATRTHPLQRVAHGPCDRDECAVNGKVEVVIPIR